MKWLPRFLRVHRIDPHRRSGRPARGSASHEPIPEARAYLMMADFPEFESPWQRILQLKFAPPRFAIALFSIPNGSENCPVSKRLRPHYRPTSGQFPEPTSDVGAVQQRAPNRMRRLLPVRPLYRVALKVPGVSGLNVILNVQDESAGTLLPQLFVSLK